MPARLTPTPARKHSPVHCTVLVAAALVAVLLSLVYGLASPTRTPASCLRSLAANTREGIARVPALRW